MESQVGLSSFFHFNRIILPLSIEKELKQELHRINFCFNSWYHTWFYRPLVSIELSFVLILCIRVTRQRFELGFILHVQWCHPVELTPDLIPFLSGVVFSCFHSLPYLYPLQGGALQAGPPLLGIAKLVYSSDFTRVFMAISIYEHLL